MKGTGLMNWPTRGNGIFLSARTLLPGACLLLFWPTLLSVTAATDPVSPSVVFNRDILPILSNNCFQCHGPDNKARQADLRLDSFEHATAAHKKGGFAVVPGDVSQSKLITRVKAEDDKIRMPPPETGKQLTQSQIGLLTRWIMSGAQWSKHWAFIKPKKEAIPSVKDPAWVHNPIDAFILARLENEGLPPSHEADRPTLVRRVSFDLTGLPPTIDDLDKALSHDSPDWYEDLVARLLTSKHYGERMAQHWLDLARYADSDGYHDDTHRSMWPFRDYVINSFNSNKPFDAFTVEQLAGDLIPGATLEQKVGSAFNRCGPTNSEGGADPKEYMAKYPVDRVNTTATVWLGVTLQCAECHDHKYDPFTTKEFYQLFSFFNQVPEQPLFRGLYSPPAIIVSDVADEQLTLLDAFDKVIARLTEELKPALEAPDPQLDAAQARWEQKVRGGMPLENPTYHLGPWYVAGPFPALDGTAAYQTAYAPEKKIDLDQTFLDGKLSWQPQPDWQDGEIHPLPGEHCATYVYRFIEAQAAQNLLLYLGSDDGLVVWHNGNIRAADPAQRRAAPDQNKVSLDLVPGNNHLLIKINNYTDAHAFYFATKPKNSTSSPAHEPIRAILAISADKRNDEQHVELRRFYRTRHARHPKVLTQQLAEAKEARADYDKSLQKLRVMADVPERRPTQVLIRGDFRRPGEEVQPGVPAVLGSLPEEAKPNRLALAKWLVDPSHPLTSRVVVNRLWQMIFGHGIVKTAEDFGTRGEWPSHPALLDWLSVEFVESAWDVKHIIRLMVTSSTYRQSSKVTPHLLASDPENRLLARGPRHRMPAEMIRDNALALSGLLDRDRPTGGPSVKPYQPPGIWRSISGGDTVLYEQDHGADLYRRTLYTFWKRSILHPGISSFDGPAREVCMATRSITNTPLQALITLNDVTYVEAARVFAQRVLNESEDGFDTQLDLAYRLALSRVARSDEQQALHDLYEDLLKHYQQDRIAAQNLVSAGEWPTNPHMDMAKHAAWTGVCNVILNLDESMTKE